MGKINISDPTRKLVILRKIIPWESIIQSLSVYYDPCKGAYGKSLRSMVALQILRHLYKLGDANVVEQVKENRYMQYFCNVPDEDLATFIDSSTLCIFRQRLGIEGIEQIELAIFSRLRISGVISGESLLMDSTVLESNIIYPNDVQLIKNAFEKMAIFAKQQTIPIWWDNDHVKTLWRAFNLAKRADRQNVLATFNQLLIPALVKFKALVEALTISDNPKKVNRSIKKKEKAQQLLALLNLLEEQTLEKLNGNTKIANRIVSLTEIDARPIKKGKINPTCEFGTTLEMSFNRQGFIVTVENFIGKPDDSTMLTDTFDYFTWKMKGYPNQVITDLGYRSADNTDYVAFETRDVFLGRTVDVNEAVQEFCCKARSATEGMIAVAKNIRGFSKSLYRGVDGDRIWSLLCQTASNLTKFIQLLNTDEIDETVMIKLGLLAK